MYMAEKKSYLIEDLKKFAELKDGKCISDKYINAHTKYLWEDHLGNQWEAKWYAILKGKWSPFLVKEKQREANLKYNIEDLQKFAQNKGGKCLSDVYINTKTYYSWVDSENNKFDMTWDCILSGQWSPFEKRKKLSSLKTLYCLKDLQDHAKKFGGTCLSNKYTKCNNIYRWKDNQGREFLRSWEKVNKSNDLIYYNPISTGHQELIDFIKNDLNIKTQEINDRLTIKGIELDILIKEKNLAIEYNGAYWHSEANKQIYPRYHLDKWIACKDKGMRLIQIFDFEWENRKKQVQSFIRSALNCNEIYLNARSLEFKEIPKKDANQFLDQYHILGSTNFTKAFGLVDINEGLVALITIGKHHRGIDEFVLSRYCGKNNVTVRGGLSKLTSNALKEFNELTTWIDLRISNGDSWIKNGWEFIHQLSPDYFYYNTKNNEIISKQSRKKSVVNTSEEMTEHEHALLDGLVRIYDCGKIKLKKSNK